VTVFIDPEQALAVVSRLGFHVRDEGLLYSALARPAANFSAVDAYPSIELKAAALLSSLARNHSLADGNKRLAWVLTVAFLNINGLDLLMSQDLKFALVVDAAQGAIEIAEIAPTISDHLSLEPPHAGPPAE
jgi:death-on-curing protein